MFRLLYIAFFFSSIIFTANAQKGFKKTFKLTDAYCSVIENIDIVKIGRHYYSYGYGNVPDSGLYTLYIVKSDENGNILDHKYIFEDKKWLSYWPSIVNRPKIAVMDSSRFAVVLANIDNLATEVFCIDTNLTKIWQAGIPKYSYNGGEWPKKVITDGDNIYIAMLTLTKSSDYIYTKVVKINNKGKLQWTKTTSQINYLWGFTFDKEKKHLLLSGANIINDPPFKNYVTKLDTSFKMLSYKYLNLNSKEDFGYNILHLANSNDYITDSYDFIPSPDYSPEGVSLGYGLNITRRDTNLNPIWKIALFPPTSYNNGFSSILPSKDGYFYAFGQVVTFMYDVADYTGFTDSVPVLNSFVTKFTEDGKVIWQRLDTLDFSPVYNYSWTEAGGVVAMEDGGLMINGTCRDYETHNRKGWMMRLDANGCLIKGDCATSSLSDPLEITENDFDIYPNPTTGIVNIMMNKKNLYKGTFKFTTFDAMGRIVKEGTMNEDNAILNLEDLNSGIYFLKIMYNDHEFGIRKIILTP